MDGKFRIRPQTCSEINKMDNQLEKQLADERIDEMTRYGRTLIYPKMRNLLDEEKARVLDLTNHGLAMVDDELDSSSNPLRQLRYIEQIFQQSYLGENVIASTPTEQAIVDLGHTLHKLASAPFFHLTDRSIGKHTYQEVLNFWKMEEKNFQRRWEILDQAALDEITLGVGALVASQFLYILDSPIILNEFVQLARVYGRAVKLADNLCDFRDDIQKGFINVSQENIHHVRGISVEGDSVTKVNPEKLALSDEYLKSESKRIEQTFRSADGLMLRARVRRPIWEKKTDKRLSLFGQFCYSWLDQMRDFMVTEDLD